MTAPKGIGRRERAVIRAAVSWYEWDNVITDEDDGYASADIAEGKHEEMVEAIGDLVAARRRAAKKAKKR